ncbi:MAG: TPR end-of-group domain-containing protein [Planctomycetota bacterium]
MDNARRALWKKEYEAAKDLYEKALVRAAEADFDQEKRHRGLLIGSHYNLACLCSLLSKGPQGPEAHGISEAEAAALRKEALDNLKRSLELGWKDLGHIGKDTDLDPLREQPEFKALVAEWKDKLKEG